MSNKIIFKAGEATIFSEGKDVTAVQDFNLDVESGEFVSFKNAEIFPKPVQKPGPPVWVGGWTDHAARRTGRLGDAWVPGWLSPAEMGRGAEVVRQTAAEHGRDPEAMAE